MRRHTRQIILSILMFLTLVVAPSLLNVHAVPSFVPGVKPGSNALYAQASGSWSIPGPPQAPFSQFIGLNYTAIRVTQVTGANVTAAQDFVYANKTVRPDNVQGSVATDSGNITFWFIAANLTAGTPIYTTPNAPVINQTVAIAFAGAERNVNVYNATQTPSPGVTTFVNVWWDQATGIVLLVDFRISTPTGSASLFMRLVQTNLWSPGPGFGMSALPNSLTVQTGGSSTSSLSFSSERGFSGNLTIDYSISCSAFCPRVIITPTRVLVISGGHANSSVTVAAPNGTASGFYSINLVAASATFTTNSTTLTVDVVGATVTTILSNDPNSPDWAINSPVWTLKNGYLDGNGATGNLSPKILSAASFSSDRTVELDFRTVAAGTQPWYTAWVIGKYLDFFDKVTLILTTDTGLQMDASLGSNVTYHFANTTFSPNQWIHAKLIFSGNNARVYLNGTLYLNFTDPKISGLGSGPISLASWGNSESEFNHVTVTASVLPDESPTAGFFVSPQPAKTGQSILFNGGQSNDPDGFIPSYSWSFGDGSTGVGEFPTHAYTNPGNYTATLTVTDSSGLTASASNTLTVVQPIVHDVGMISLYPSPTVAISGQTILVNAGLVNLGLQPETVSLTVYYDSHVAGTLSGISLPVTQYPFYFSVAWDTSGVAPGNYTISGNVFLSTDQNPSNNHLVDGQVTILPPPALVTTPLNGPVGTKVLVHGSGFQVSTGVPLGFPITVHVTFDDQFVGFTSITNGSFDFVFDIPVSQPGLHKIHAYAQFYPTQVEATANFTVTPTQTTGGLTLTVSVGTIYFPGDTVTVYLLSSFNGNPSQAQMVHLTLFLPNGTARTLVLTSIGPGLYKASSPVSASNSLGTYALVASAQVNNVNSTALGSFEVKLTWLQSNGHNLATAGSIAGAVGTISVFGLAWRKGYFTKRKDEFQLQ